MSETRSTIIQAGEGLELSFEQARLLIEEGPDAGQEVLLSDRPLVIGRSQDADLVLSDAAVSRRHARIEPAARGWRIVDLDSRAGLSVDGVAVATSGPLQPGARIKLGGTLLVFQVRREELLAPPEASGQLEKLVGSSHAMRQLFGMVRKLAELDLPVLVVGETGTGKEAIAHAIHAQSPRAPEPYEVVDCTLLEREHLRSELFGHVKGAFTGADSAREGAFVRAGAGTLLLDEVGELPLELQPALLRVLQEGEVRPLGGSKPVQVRTRVVSATHRDLAAKVAEGTFREDLYYRLSALTLEVPPLRDREDDILLLARHFLPPGVMLADEAAAALRSHPWPGNVRELENVIRQAAALATGRRILRSDLKLDAARPSRGIHRPALRRKPGEAGEAGSPLAGAEDPAAAARRAGAPSLADAEETAILAALERCGGNRTLAAEQLGISRSTLYRKLEKMGIE